MAVTVFDTNQIFDDRRSWRVGRRKRNFAIIIILIVPRVHARSRYDHLTMRLIIYIYIIYYVWSYVI